MPASAPSGVSACTMSTDSVPGACDDKSPVCLSFILSLLHRVDKFPLFVGLSGAQGSGKSTLGYMLSRTLSEEHGFPSIVVSIDDFYLTHAEQLAFAEKHKLNKIIQMRGPPGTHDINLARTVFSALREGRECQIPVYDKSAYHGKGDRVPKHQWRIANQGVKTVTVVILEGWCVGFSQLTHAEIEQKRNLTTNRSLAKHELQNLLDINDKLKEYQELWSAYLDGLIYIDAKDLRWVYDWREDQEKKLRKEKGNANAMDLQQVIGFVDSYLPAYELYTENLRKTGVISQKGQARRIKQLNLVVGKDRKVLQVLSH
ncbi:putative kinase mug58 [Golovinomyces cichoracearum]|uniref:Putative kinase mug58 n=1 Tax=Golovinomyces cichoracearum TaxID=62708 RepID=A0A420HG66_9PEZI|nr:putative kinase mug58 [Golovinomyces cichoracearum]